MKIVIEGMDGVGKTTVAKRIAQKISFKYVDGLMNSYFIDKGYTKEELKTLKKVVEDFYKIDDSIIRTWVMGMANIFNIQYYKDENLIIDRHCLTTYFWNADEKSKNIYKVMQELVGKPDLIIILEASCETRIKRLYNRNINDDDLNDKNKLIYGYDKFLEAAEFLDVNYIVINTDNKEQEEVYKEIEKFILNYLKENKKNDE
ncbi:MAG: AAA family ATPase [Bacilli bacterium]|nr:AAA family ATPase [Bacilli bacterium]